MTAKNKSITLTLLIISFLTLALLVIQKNIFVLNIDTMIFNFISTMHFPSFLDKMIILITKILDPREAVFLLALGIGFLFVKKEKYSWYILALATIIAIALAEIIKFFIGRVRPMGHLIVETGASFPSVHATAAAVFFYASLFLIAPVIKNEAYKKIFVILSAIIFPLVALSRIYLSVHWTTDVIGGIILGSLCYLFANIAIRFFEEKH